MTKIKQSTPFIWRIARKLKGLLIKMFKRDTPAGDVVLLLTTIGRKSGLDRVTPLQYEELDGLIYVASVRGQAADWFRNIQANPRVKVQIKGVQLDAIAEPITDPERIADFLEIRLQNRPLMVRLIMTLGGLPLKYDRGDLVEYAAGRALVIIHPTTIRKDHLYER